MQCLRVMLHELVLLAIAHGTSPAPPTTAGIVDRMLRADAERHSALAGYTGMRRYHFDNKRVNKLADMTVHVTCDATGAKTFEVVDESGSSVVRNRILRKMLEAEEESSKNAERNETRITPDNYDFKLIGAEVLEGRESYVLEITPKNPSKFSIRGRIWVDSKDFAITRVEGQPAKNPSFWIRSVHVVQRYGRVGQFWFPVMNQSEAEARIFGATSVSIEYFDYVPSVHDAQARAVAVKERGQ